MAEDKENLNKVQDSLGQSSNETEQKINQLQLYEQSLQNILLQKQQFQAQATEIDSALSQLEGSSVSYKIIGNIMIKSKKEELEKDLKEKKSIAQLRIKTFEKQESDIKEKVKSLQEEVMKNIQNKD
ncbi:MAG: prefoldin subunit beta [Nanoarchaeota archaeon]|nr:prefoldin subunit beta [Nanoarchaeota archaeon]